MSSRRLARTIATLAGSLLCFTIAAQPFAAPSQRAVRPRAVAVTFDDLPFAAAGGPYFPAAARVTSELLRVLRQHRAPAIGFVNEAPTSRAGA